MLLSKDEIWDPHPLESHNLHDHPVPTSSFSSRPMPSQAQSTNTITARDSMTDVEAVMVPSPRIRDRFTKLFFGIRTVGREREPHTLPIQQPQLCEWPPLHIEKRALQCCEHCRKRRKKHKRNRILFIILIVLLLYLLGNIVALNTRTFAPSLSSSNASSLSADQQLCLSEFNINARANASLYPCSTCFSVLQSVSPKFLEAHAQEAQEIQNAIQFCALRSVFVEADNDGQSDLSTGGWVQNVQFCAWSGVKCNTDGQVTSLQLTTPAVPAIIPNEIGGLAGLQTLQIIGNANLPAGSLPSSVVNLTALSTLELQSTALTALPDDLFAFLGNISTLSLVKNAKMGSSLPSSITGLLLQNLVVTNQALDNPLSALVNSSSVRSSMKLLDLSMTNLTGTIPSSISSISSLVELHLDNNDLTDPLPSTFPAKLQILTLANNTELSGSVTGSFCSLSSLQTCDMEDTALKAAGSCGVCKFSS